MRGIARYGLASAAVIFLIAGAAQAQMGEALLEGLLDRIVERIDEDGNGRIAKSEAEAARRQHFAAADQDGDGVLSEAEFTEHAVMEIGAMSRPWLAPIFAALDRNADQRLSKAEVRRAGNTIFARADRNGDGALSPAEIRPDLAMAQ